MSVTAVHLPAPPVADVAPECLRCGYSLRGLGDDAACPECGVPARHSLVRGRELRHAPPPWLRALSAGTWLVLGVLAGAPLLFQGLGLFFPLVSFQTVVIVFALLRAAEAAVLAAGVWLLTRPLGPFAPPAPAAWWAARAVALVLVAQEIAAFVPIGWVLRARMPFYTVYFWLVLGILLALHLRRLAQRLPNVRLGKLCAATAAGFAAAGVVAVVDEALGLTPRAGLEITAAALGFVAYLGMLYVLLRTGAALWRARRESVAAWGGSGWGVMK
jgi:hypothetical protein